MVRACEKRPLNRAPVVLLFVLLLAPLAGIGITDTQGEQATASGRPLAPMDGVWLEEVVTFPLTDWNENGLVSTTDEYLVIRNHGSDPVDLSGWSLVMEDSTPETLLLEGLLASGASRLILNPPGQMNNDVALTLRDATDAVVDHVALGVEGIPNGRGQDMHDEAVHLSGPWAARRAPGTFGHGLPATYVVRIAPAALLDPPSDLPEPFATAWIAEGARIAVETKSAQEGAGPSHLVFLGTSYALEPVPDHTGWWRTAPVAVAANVAEATLVVHAGSVDVATFPDGAPLLLRHDASPPALSPFPGASAIYAAADGAGRVHAFPAPVIVASGVHLLGVERRDDGTSTAMPGCLPLDAPGPDCVLSEGTEGFVVTLRTGAGLVGNVSFPVEVWDTPPQIPLIDFLPGPPPRLLWAPASRPLSAVLVEHAADGEGAGASLLVAGGGEGSEAVDATWVPGTPRFYRLRMTDMVGNEGIGAWTPLDPASVPVQAEWNVAIVGPALAMEDTVNVTLTTDRAVAAPPRLVLSLDRPTPLIVEQPFEPTAEPQRFLATLRLPAPLAEASGTWRLVDGEGVDGAPFAPRNGDAVWDLRAPVVTWGDVENGWQNASKVVLPIAAEDGVDAEPRISFSQLPPGTNVTGTGGSRLVTVHGDGDHRVVGNATDAHGNAASFEIPVRLDTVPPVVALHARPAVWSAETPVVLDVQDALSGPDPAHLRVWVRNVTTVVEGNVSDWNGTRVQVIPGAEGGVVYGPLEVYAAVADRAGNAFEGLLGSAVFTAASSAVTPPVGGAQGSLPRAPLPPLLGPGWGNGTAPQEVPTGQGDPLGNGSASSGNGAVWGALASRKAADEDGAAPFAWLLVGLAGTVGLGTIAHRVQRNRRRTVSPGRFDAAPDPPPGDALPPATASATFLRDDPPEAIDGTSVAWTVGAACACAGVDAPSGADAVDGTFVFVVGAAASP